MPSVAPHIDMLADVLAAAAAVDSAQAEAKRRYVHELLLELLCTDTMPGSLERRLASFNPIAFSLSDWAADFRREQPMRPRRVVELISYVLLADGELTRLEGSFLRAVATALGMDRDEYAHLLPADMPGPSDSFVDMAPVPLPMRRE